MNTLFKEVKVKVVKVCKIKNHREDKIETSNAS